MTTNDFFGQLNDNYLGWLRNNTILKEIDERCVEITTPFLDRHNDCLQVYAFRNGNDITLTDDGYTIADLRMNGCDIDSPKRKAVLEEVLAGHCVRVVDDRLEITGQKNHFARTKHNLIQAMLSVDDMFYLAAPSPHTMQFFTEQTEDWLRESDVRFSRDILFLGKSGFSYKFFGIIPASKQQPERILRTVNNPSAVSCKQSLFEWVDISESRPDAMLVAFLNDSEKPLDTGVLAACKSYNITGIAWSKREKFTELLAG